jgi:glycosyltransferase involved in cell wall biosynthesis
LSGNSTLGNRDYAQWIDINEDRIHLVRNAIEMRDNPEQDPQVLKGLRDSLGIAANTPVVLGVFRLSEEKQPLLFLDVCDRVRRQLPDLRVLIAGTGELLQAAQTEIAERDLGKIVSLLGPRQDVPVLMSISTVMLHTSMLEGMPNAVMEAQALALPVVATRAGGTPDCVDHGRTGFLCDIDDADGLAQATFRLLSDKELRRTMGRAAAARVRAFFTKEQMAAEMARIALHPEDKATVPLPATA